jgi:signal transduction histidine kinase
VALESKGLVTALREMATEWTQQSNIVANLRVEGTYGTKGQGAKEQGNVQGMPFAVEEALYRVAQEALANVARHSEATLVQIVLTTTDETVTLSISDNGQGFDTTRQGYLGVVLLSMQERMKALGGDVRIESAPGKGTHVIAFWHRSGVGRAAMSDGGVERDVSQLEVGAKPLKNEGHG